MKNFSFLKYALFVMASIAIVGFNSCDPEDEEQPILVEDGFYLKGTAAGLEQLDIEGMMAAGRVEGPEFATLPREGMYEKFLYLTAGTFNLVEVTGARTITWGWDGAGQQDTILDGTMDQIAGTLYHGAVVADGTPFTVTTAGLYHVIFDQTTARVWFTRITHWGAIGDATELGWSGQYMMEEVFANADSAKWEATEVIIRARGGVKFRYNSGWKISHPGDFIFFANIGNEEGNYVMGAGTFPHPTPEGVYTVTLRWNSETGWSRSFTRTGNVEPLPQFPAQLFMIGGSVGGWDWALIDLPMIPVHSKPHLFWRIQWLDATAPDQGFKFSPVKGWLGQDFGRTGTATDGIFARGTDNIPVPAAGSGYYMVVVNLATGHIAVVPPQVYLMGGIFDPAWGTANPAGLFTVDNTNHVLTWTGALSAGDLRMYAWFDAAPGWFTDWWQSEFVILDGNIAFRGAGGDQTRVPITAGNYRINLNFRTGAGTVAPN